MTREELEAKLAQLEAQKKAIEDETRLAIQAASRAAQVCRSLSANGFAVKSEIAKTKQELASLPKDEPAPTPAP